MESIRTRILRATAASALVLTLGGALGAGPAAAEEQPGAHSSSIVLAAREPIDTRSASSSADVTDTLDSGWSNYGWYSSKPACLGTGVGLVASGQYEDFLCGRSGVGYRLFVLRY